MSDERLMELLEDRGGRDCRVTVALRQEEMKALRQLAAANGISLAGAVRIGIRRLIAYSGIKGPGDRS